MEVVTSIDLEVGNLMEGGDDGSSKCESFVALGKEKFYF